MVPLRISLDACLPVMRSAARCSNLWRTSRGQCESKECNFEIEESGVDLAKAADMYDEVVEHYIIVGGTEHPYVKAQKANAARVRAMLK